MKALRVMMLLLAIGLLTAWPVAAQDDTATDDTVTDDTGTDDTGDDTGGGGEFSATLDFSNPLALEADTQYDFEFTVTNTTASSAVHQWVEMVELYMPSEQYQIDAANIHVPDPLHGGEWIAQLATDHNGIKWQYNSGVTTGEGFGDIHEGESLDFAFKATSDSAAKDGFDFRLTADSGAFVEGTAYIGEQSDDTSDDTGDDTTPAADDDDSGNNGGCCG